MIKGDLVRWDLLKSQAYVGMANTETLSRRERDRNTPIHKAVEENNGKREEKEYEWWPGRFPAAGGAFPFASSASRVCVHLRVWCYVRKKCDVHTAVLTAALSQQGKTTDPLWTCVFMRGRERFFFFCCCFFFLAGLLTIQPLSNPALPLSTYNMAAYPLAGLQTGERNLQMRRERAIRGRVIENTQRARERERESTDSQSRATKGRCSVCVPVCVCVCVCVCVWREKALMNKGLHCERDKLTLRDIWRNTFIVSPAENKYQVSAAPECKRDTVQETCLINSLAATRKNN